MTFDGPYRHTTPANYDSIDVTCCYDCLPGHDFDGLRCWCEPTLRYASNLDALLVVHQHPQ